MTVFKSMTFGTRSDQLELENIVGTRFRQRILRAGKWALRGRPKDPVWERPTLLLLLLANSILYFGNIGGSGWANSFYSAAVQSGSKDWVAFFFGSSDWGNAITVDKPPLSLWIMGFSVRIFGWSPESVLAPQAAMGVMTTFLIYLLMRRGFSATAALTGSAVFATTPIVTLLSRYNNPDPLMLLLMVGAALFTIRSIESGRIRHLACAGLLLGLGFMTKQLQALMCLPALALAFSVCAPGAWRTKLRTSCFGLLVLVVSGGLWITVVELIPPSARPYIGGSTNNSEVQLTLAYNGLNRLIPATKDPTVGLIPAQYRAAESDEGIFRLFNANFAQEASWLLAVALLCCIWICVGNKGLHTSSVRKSTVIVSVSWFLTTYLMLSFMGDGIHTYYTATLAPPLALVIGLGLEALLVMRSEQKARLLASLTVLIGSLIAWVLLGSVVGWSPVLVNGVLAAGIGGAVLTVVPPPAKWLNAVAFSLAAAGLLGGPLATSIYTSSVAHSGSNPLSGRITTSPASVSRFLEGVSTGGPGWAYDMGFGFDPSPNLIALTKAGSSCVWAAATYPSQSAAKLQLAAAKPVLPLGGFAGTDPAPSLQQFRDQVTNGKICFLVWHQDHLDLPGRSPTLIEISAWVKSEFHSFEVDGVTVFDLRSRN